jgi:hypothetical protein
MEQKYVVIRVTERDYERLVKLVERDEKTRTNSRLRQMEKYGRTYCTAYLQKIELEILEDPEQFDETGDVDEPTEEVSQEESTNE